MALVISYSRHFFCISKSSWIINTYWYSATLYITSLIKISHVSLQEKMLLNCVCKGEWKLSILRKADKHCRHNHAPWGTALWQGMGYTGEEENSSTL